MKLRLFWISFVMFCLCLVYIDRFFLKKNDEFCIRNVLGSLPQNHDHQTVGIDSFLEEKKDEVFSQPFYYLAKGHQSYVFVSKDQKYVLKFYRFPSHMRPFPWLNHLLSRHFSKKRKAIEKYNLDKFTFTLNSFKIAKECLPEETGLLAIHLNKTNSLHKKVEIVDSLKHSYFVDLDSTLFVLQKKAHMIYPILQQTLQEKNFSAAKGILRSLFQLAQVSHAKGIVNHDAMIEKNFGWLNGKAIFIDIGRFEKEIKKEEEQEMDFRKMIMPVIHWLKVQNEPFAKEIENEVNFYKSSSS